MNRNDKIRYADETDLKIINNYFEDSGRVFTKDDCIVAIENSYDVAVYLYQDNIYEFLKEMDRRKPIDEDMNLIENLINDLSNVY